MTEMHAYVVSIAWSDGMMSTAPLVAGGNTDGREHAAAMAVVMSMRSEPAPKGAITAMQVRELPLEWLRTAIRMIESGKVDGAPVVHLVEPQGRMPSNAEAQMLERFQHQYDPPEPPLPPSPFKPPSIHSPHSEPGTFYVDPEPPERPSIRSPSIHSPYYDPTIFCDDPEPPAA